MARWVLALLCAVACAPPSSATTPGLRPDAPLSVAVWRGDEAAVQRMLATGADIDAMDRHELTAWAWAEVAQDQRMFDLLLAHRTIAADRKVVQIALDIAASAGDIDMVRGLLAHGAAVDVAGRTSTLTVAAANGEPELVKLLLDHGARIDARDREGDTPLIAARRAGCAECVQLLHGQMVAAPSAPPPTTPSVRDAIARSVPLLQRNAAHWIDEPGCPSCHHQPMAIQVTAIAEQRGVAVDRALATKLRDFLRDDNKAFASTARVALVSDDAVLRLSMNNGGDVAFGNAWFLAAMADAGTPRSPDLTIAAELVARMQQRDGRWRHGPTRGVIESSDLATTALAVRALTAYGSPSHGSQIALAGRWLVAARPATTLEQVYALQGLIWSHADAKLVATAARSLRDLQLADGSWSHRGSVGDAYTTGLALVALQRAGALAAGDPAYLRGVDYLLRTQQTDGSWFVPSRAAGVLDYFDSGFPHGRHQFISFAGTAWATLALLYTLPN